MKTENIDLNKLRVASPCAVGWNSMTGDDRTRMCKQCDRHVYNISEMSTHEIEKLIFTRTDRVCVQLFRRSDGTVLTNDCPVGKRLVRKRLANFAVAAFSSVLGLVTFGYGQASEKPKQSPGKAEKIERVGKGILRGTVTDSAGGLIPGARLELFQEGVKKPRKIVSDENGKFAFDKLPAGTFNIKARFDGFKKTIIENIVLNDEQTASVNLVMEAGSINVTVGMLDFQ